MFLHFANVFLSVHPQLAGIVNWAPRALLSRTHVGWGPWDLHALHAPRMRHDDGSVKPGTRRTAG